MPRKPKSRAPWGEELLGGKPIERLLPLDDSLGDVCEKDATAEQYRRMCKLKEYYGIEGEAGWRPWFQLTLAIASQLDDALTIIDPLPNPTGKTAKRWTGAEGMQLIEEIKALKEGCEAAGKSCTDEALLVEHQELYDRYRKMPFEHLRANYYAAKRCHRDK